MEPVKNAKLAPEYDVISCMPDNVITNIMDRLPIRAAVKTSILSSNWRFKWTMLTQLVFDDAFFKVLPGPQGANYYNSWDVMKFLLHLKGPITKFVLCLPHSIIVNVEDVNNWFLLLSTKGLKNVVLKNMHETPLKLPTHFFSCLELEYMKLRDCSFCLPPSFHAFSNLLSLNLNRVTFESFTFGKLITQCPLLESLFIRPSIYDLSDIVKTIKFVKLDNLTVFALILSKLDTTSFTSSSIFQLVDSFPKLQKLYLGFGMCKLSAEIDAGKVARTTFPCLKTLGLYSIDFGNDTMVSFVFEMISCSPNLHTLIIMDSVNNDVPPPALCHSGLHSNINGHLQLREVLFESFRGSKTEVCLIKSLLAFSPLLKNFLIKLKLSSMNGDADGKFKVATKLLQLSRASPAAKIYLF